MTEEQFNILCQLLNDILFELRELKEITWRSQ